MIADQRAVAHHEDPVGDSEHLGESMGNEHAGRASVAVIAQAVEEPLGLVTGERSRRFIEDQDTSILVQRPGDHHELLAGEVEVADARVGGDLDAEIIEDRRRSAAHRQAVDEAKPCRLVVQEQRPSHGQLGHHVDLLGDQHDSVTLRIGDVGREVREAVERDLAAVVLPEQAGEDADDRRLAGAVLAEQGDDLGRGEVERQLVNGDRATERLADTPDGEQAVRGASAFGAVVEHRGRVGAVLLGQHSGRSSGTLAYTSSTFCQYS